MEPLQASDHELLPYLTQRADSLLADCAAVPGSAYSQYRRLPILTLLNKVWGHMDTPILTDTWRLRNDRLPKPLSDDSPDQQTARTLFATGLVRSRIQQSSGGLLVLRGTSPARLINGRVVPVNDGAAEVFSLTVNYDSIYQPHVPGLAEEFVFSGNGLISHTSNAERSSGWVQSVFGTVASQLPRNPVERALSHLSSFREDRRPATS